MNEFSLENISFSIHDGSTDKIILDNISFYLKAGEITFLWGPNGSGKSSTVNVIADDIQNNSEENNSTSCSITGDILLFGKSIKKLPAYKRTSFLSRVTQKSLDMFSPSLTLEENLAMLYSRSLFRTPFKIPITKSFKKMICERFSNFEFDISKRLQDFPSSFSGGELQYISFLGATLNNPKILLLDEHTRDLDVNNKSILENMTVDYIKQKESLSLWITHDPNQVIKFADKIIWIKKGKIEYTSYDSQGNIESNDLLQKLIAFQSN